MCVIIYFDLLCLHSSQNNHWVNETGWLWPKEFVQAAHKARFFKYLTFFKYQTINKEV